MIPARTPEQETARLAEALWPGHGIAVSPLGPGRWGVWIGKAVNPLVIAQAETREVAMGKVERYLHAKIKSRLDAIEIERKRLEAALEG